MATGHIGAHRANALHSSDTCGLMLELLYVLEEAIPLQYGVDVHTTEVQELLECKLLLAADI